MFSFTRSFLLNLSLALILNGITEASVIEKRDNTGAAGFYATGLGACGVVSSETDFMVAVSHEYFDTFPGYNGINPNNNPVCGRSLQITYQGRSIQVKVLDRCEWCGTFDLDLSPAAFNVFADFSVGLIQGVDWILL